MRIYLVGFMGSGKTHVGQKLANRLGFQFFDLDSGIELETGNTVSQIFEEMGERAFRILEARILRQTAELSNYVIATGGGAPCFHQNMRWMNEHGITIYLHSAPALISSRLEKDLGRRPLLQGKTGQPLLDLIEKKMCERVEFYNLAHLQLEISEDGDAPVEELIQYLCRFVKF